MLKIRAVEAAVLLAALFATGCQVSSASDKDRQAAEQAAVRAHAEEKQAGEASKKAMRARLDELEHRIAALKTDAKPATDKAHREADEKTKKLQAEVEALRAKLSTHEGRTEEWNKLKENTEEALNKIERKLDELGPSKK